MKARLVSTLSRRVVVALVARQPTVAQWRWHCMYGAVPPPRAVKPCATEQKDNVATATKSSFQASDNKYTTLDEDWMNTIQKVRSAVRAARREADFQANGQDTQTRLMPHEQIFHPQNLWDDKPRDL